MGQAVAQVPADHDRDHLRREPEPGKGRPLDLGTGGLMWTHPPSFLGLPLPSPPGSTTQQTPGSQVRIVTADRAVRSQLPYVLCDAELPPWTL